METAKPPFVIPAIAVPILAPALYVVATPIGNLADVTLRALQTLAAVDLILCEDTRTSGKLLARYGIKTPLRALHEHNETGAAPALVREIAGGRTMALITDAGTPLLSDPGFVLVRLAAKTGLDIVPVPGASALLAGLSVAGLPTNRFTFCGFAPPKKVARAKWLADLAHRPETLVFYESPRRLAGFLAALAEQFGPERPVAIGRELTKRFETLYRGPVGDLAREFKGQPVKGEVVVMVDGATTSPADPALWRTALAKALGEMALRDAVAKTTQEFGLRRTEVYAAALKLRAPKP